MHAPRYPGKPSRQRIKTIRHDVIRPARDQTALIFVELGCSKRRTKGREPKRYLVTGETGCLG